MIKNSDLRHRIFPLFQNICEHHKYSMYLFGDYAKYIITNQTQFCKTNIVKLSLVSDNFDVSSFYKEIIQHIVVNEELENNKNKYSFVSENFIFDIDIVQDIHALIKTNINTDFVFVNLNKFEVISLQDNFDSNNVNLRIINELITLDDVFDLILHASMFDVPRIDIKTLDILKNKSITDFSLGKTSYEDFVNSLLLTYKPGWAIKFITENINNGREWVFDQILNFVIKNNIPIQDDIKISEVFSKERLDLVDLYNVFFLSNRETPEFKKDQTNRIITTLRLLFNVPTLDLSLPYFKGNSTDKQEQFSLFEDQGCTYGPCLECNPENCNPQCCCCHSIDIVSAATARCHKRTVISCNEDGSGWGLESDQNFEDCPNCVTACETILGLRPDLIGEGCDNFLTTGSSEGWWTIPSSNWPCDCHCANESSGTCRLTCVTCRNLFCTSEADVSGNDCNYRINLTPGEDCCGDQPREEIIFVIDATECVTRDGNAISHVNIKSLTTEVVNRINNINPNVRYGLVTFDDPHLESDSEGTRYVAELTNKDDFLSQIPDTIVTGDATDTPFPSVWYAGIRALVETNWSSSARRKIIFVGGKTDQYIFDTSSPPAICQGYPPIYSLGECFEAYMAISQENNITTNVIGHHVNNFPIDSRQIDILGSSGASGNCWSTYSVSDDDPDLFFIINDFTNCVEEFSGYSSSCDCVNSTPIPIRQNSPNCQCYQEDGLDDPFDIECISNLPESCFEIPIIKCLPGQPCNCSLPSALNICGQTVVIQPVQQNLVCCSDLGFGCQCDDGGGGSDSHPTECCGVSCHDICAMYRQNQDVESLIDFVWADCWTKKAGVDVASTPKCSEPCCPDASDPNSNNYPCELREAGDTRDCCPCPLENQSECCNCCVTFMDTNGIPSIVYCRTDIAQQVRSAIEDCLIPDPPTSPPWNPPNTECRDDKCIVGEPNITEDQSIDSQCDNKHSGCTSVIHPSTVVLNNGIGLVAYESIKDVSTIKIQQFNTSLKNKLLPNRELGFGRLQHRIRWGTTIAKLYVYDPIPQHLLTGTESPENSENWKDAIAFKNGPLEKQFFPLAVPAYDTDEIGTFLRFYHENTELTRPFTSSDDVYNIKYFVFDFEDEGVIGDSNDTTTDGSEFNIENRNVVDQALLLSPHIYNGEKVPVANPSITTAKNYYEPLENSHFVYLTYQALEDNIWKIYLRQLRLSEYQSSLDNENETHDSLSNLGLSSVIYRIFCTNDHCSDMGDYFVLSRSVVFEVLTEDRREVLNPNLIGNWPSLCPGKQSSEFPREKVFVKLVHYAESDRCPESVGFNSIFANWIVGQEFLVPAADISAQGIFNLVQTEGDSVIAIDNFDPPITAGDAVISSSYVNVVYYQSITESLWSVISGSSYDTLSRFKGLKIGEPILVSNDSGHATQPVVKVNHNNDIFIAYQTTELNGVQIKLIGTSIPSTSLPVGVFNPKDPDKTLRYLLSPSDFIYSNTITTDGLNEMVDMFIDLNDVLHLTWQSNKTKRWEIYYGNSEDQFSIKQITDHTGKSLKPSIYGDNLGKIFIAWHDDRFGNGYEIMLAFCENSNITPLSQQDPYLASIRNEGYTHYIDELSFSIRNQNSYVICIQDIIADFYYDRTLNNLAFSVHQSDYPFIFTIPGVENDTHIQSYSDFTLEWTDDPYIVGIISNEFDTGLFNSVITRFSLDFTTFDSTENPIEISFRASDTAGDSLFDSQWSPWFGLNAVGDYLYVSFSSNPTKGRYKQIKIRFNYNSTQPTMNSLSVVSESMHRICLSPGQSVSGVVDLTPELRIDAIGDQTSEFALPVNIEPNRTYFVKIRGKDDNLNSITFNPQLSSISCESCMNTNSSWNLKSCSIKVDILNTEDIVSYYNFKVHIYFDAEKTRKVNELNLSHGSSDLNYVSVNNISAKNVWTSTGLQVGQGIITSFIIWPNLHPNIGLVCGISYYVDIEFCKNTDAENNCNSNEYEMHESIKWICDCSSLRWDPIFEDSPINIRELKRWNSSGYGFSDTRLTETIDCNNINPVIKITSNQSVIVMYQSNRFEDNNSDYKIFASLFSVLPRYDMFASANQFINSPFESIIHRSDIPICSNSNGTLGCYDANNQRVGSTIKGENVSFDLDQYDQIFMATEVSYNNECNNFAKNQQKYILVHTCGADHFDIFGLTEETNSDICAKNILQKSFVENDMIGRKTQVVARVLDDYVDYYVNKNNVNLPILSKCRIKIEIIGSKETIAVRVKNSSDKNYSNWYSMSNLSGKNAIIIDWQLSNGSGIQLIQFECATPAGVSETGLLNVFADYKPIVYDLNIYLPTENTPYPPESVDIRNEDLWSSNNLVPGFKGSSVASIRPPTSQNGIISIPYEDYAFIEIIPDAGYMTQFSHISDEDKLSGNSNIEPVFDFIQQGYRDFYGISTVWARNINGIEVFRGIITIRREDMNAFKDGLASINPRFKGDCSSKESTSTSEFDGFIKDKFNLLSKPAVIIESNDIYSRDQYGSILYKNTLRPDDDPYFVFGDPNYGLNK